MLNGFSTCVPSTQGLYRIPGTKRSLWLRRETAPLLLGFAAEFHRLVEPIDVRTLDDWGYACRQVRGRNVPSFHSAGIAIDLNALRHALGRRNTFTPRQATIIRALCRKYGLRWGGDYRVRADEMHVEVIINRAAALALVRRLQTPVRKPAVTPPADRVLRLTTPNMTGPDVLHVQYKLGRAGYSVLQDSRFGSGTEAQLKRFQTKRGMVADGVCGPAVWRALREVA